MEYVLGRENAHLDFGNVTVYVTLHDIVNGNWDAQGNSLEKKSLQKIQSYFEYY